MTPEDVLSHAPRVLSEAQRKFYFDNGYLVVENLVPEASVERLRAVTAEKIEESRAVAASDEAFDLGPGHRPEAPHVRRLRAVVDRHPDYWALASDSVVTDLAADLVGPDVKFHSAKLNFKWPHEGNEVRWHQDIPFWPHTNYSPLTIGVCLEDMGPEDGPATVVPGSHDGELFELYDGDTWTGHIADQDLERVALDTAVDLTGPAGTAIVIHCRTVHGSGPNLGEGTRPLLLNVYSSADAFPYTAAPTPTSHTGEIVRGGAARRAHLDPRPCPLPPDWGKSGYGSIFAVQKGEQKTKRATA